MPQSVVVFTLAGRSCAFRLEDVDEIVALPALARPPALPPAIEGFLNLRGNAVPVIRLDRLFDLPAQNLELYTPLLVLRGPLAIPVAAVHEVVELPAEIRSPAESSLSFNSCVAGEFDIGDRRVHLLSGERVLALEERQRIFEFQTLARQRLELLEPGR